MAGVSRLAGLLCARRRRGSSPNDPRNAVPVSLRPGKHSVHHSYIWLGGLSALGAIAVAVVISSLGSIISLIEGGLSSIVALLIAAGVGIVMALVIGGIVFSVQWLSWKNLSYELTPTEFSLFFGNYQQKTAPRALSAHPVGQSAGGRDAACFGNLQCEDRYGRRRCKRRGSAPLCAHV